MSYGAQTEASVIEVRFNQSEDYVSIYDWREADHIVFSGSTRDAIIFLTAERYPASRIFTTREGVEPTWR